MAKSLIRVEFEVYGQVQGVFFRKHTANKGTELGLKGWCMNSSEGTVKGVMEGPTDKVATMKSWLQTTGSPMSRIDKAQFQNEESIATYSFDKFGVRKETKR